MHKSQLVSRKKIKVHLLLRNCLETFLFHRSPGYLYVHPKSHFKVGVLKKIIFFTNSIHFFRRWCIKLVFFRNFKWQLNLNTPGWLIACIPGARVIFTNPFWENFDGCNSMHSGFNVHKTRVEKGINIATFSLNLSSFRNLILFRVPTSWFELKFQVWIKCNTKQSRLGQPRPSRWSAWTQFRINHHHEHLFLFWEKLSLSFANFVFPVHLRLGAAAGAGVTCCSLLTLVWVH